MIDNPVLKTGLVIALVGGLALAPMAAPAPLARYVSGEAHADAIGNFFKKANKPKRKGTSNDPRLGIKVLQGIGVGLAVVGIARGNAGAIIIGTALAAAPIVFREELERKYGPDQGWAGCLACNQKRVLVQPGRMVSDDEQEYILTQVEEDVMDIQRALWTLGYYRKGIDGDYGPGSRRAAAEFQRSLGTEPTGSLTARERAELFRLASTEGFVPQSTIGATALMGVETVPFIDADDGETINVFAPQESEPAAPMIAEYRLAQSQLEKFTNEVLRKGDLSEVENAILLPDGLLEIEVRDPAAPRKIVGGVETIAIAPHDLSDEWLRVSMPDPTTGTDVALNTIDSFSSKAEADDWRAKAEKLIGLLTKLTERDVSDEPPMVVAEAEAESEPESAPAPAETDPEAAPSETPDDGAEPVSARTAPARPAQCGESLYVSFNFPEDYDDINHFNISTPESAIMTDNGDGTGYLTGSCVQGEYQYKYVIIHHDEASKKWSSSVQEGSFVIASLAGQCEIDLNDPAGSATLHCY
ncbi:peptidoglycan-binding domain-containing protein [Breoghania sp.]|uniref:peptidoglycan-binding domain-containing protein n=1 Tax=Breoghania sp. TaxID=2065378 RepID=UPI002AA8B2CE|nr:peptidoglycan-binding domain-containing protein [Breoghania sp.]